MVISFSVKEAREQLLNKEVVYTFRWKRRKFFEKQLGTLEYTWFNEKRGGKAIGYVWIEEVGEFDPTAPLTPYVSQSGFKDLWEWQEVIEEMKHITWSSGWLYKVMLIALNDRQYGGQEE